MKVMIVGGGGREHAMGIALAASSGVKLVFAPGNPGTGSLGRNLDVAVGDIDGLVAAAIREEVQLVVPGPELPLVGGLADALSAAGIACCGPGSAAARLEGSKAFTRDLTRAAGVPSPDYRVVDRTAEVGAAIATFATPPVVKADGLAGGKGVFLPDTAEDCADIARQLLGGRLGVAGVRVVFEERLAGVEASLFYACRGRHLIALPHARDHKRIGDGDRGPNTGGMGAISPNHLIDSALEKTVRTTIVEPVLDQLIGLGSPFVGFLYAGLMLTENGPKLLEFNVRLGDPEAQAILPRLEDGAFLDLCRWVTLEGGDVPSPWFDPRSCCAVVLAAHGYPGEPRRGDAITIGPGLTGPDRWFVHAATRVVDRSLVVDGGRVGAVVARGATAVEARRAAYEGVSLVDWEGMTYRTDIGLNQNG